MALGTCAEGIRILGRHAAAHARARQTDPRMVRQRAGKLSAGPTHCGGAAQNVRRAPAGGARPCDRGDPYQPDGASRQGPPRGVHRTERHCKWVGDGMRVPWAWRSGLARRGPKSLANPPLCTPERGRPTHAWSDRGLGSSTPGRRIAEERHGTSVGRPRAELGRATEATPTSPTGHPDKAHPGGSIGPSGIANGWGTGCASHGHGARDLRGGDPNPWPIHRCARPSAADRRMHGPTEGWEARRRAGALRRSGTERP
ncbi:hypothetical protein COCNU_scaffold006362G000060 [Cocos nucifera]|nr:hypothetical protein [Cocos nucifera]